MQFFTDERERAVRDDAEDCSGPAAAGSELDKGKQQPWHHDEDSTEMEDK